MATMSLPSGLRHGLGIAQRTIAAILGGYGIATLASIGIARALPMARADAVMTAALLALLLYACAAIWAFSPVSLGRMWIGLLLAAAPLAALSWPI